MGYESIVCGLERFVSKIESIRADQAANFEKAFQNNYNEGTRPRHISTINEGMVGKSVYGVKFARRVFTLSDGEKVEGVFPVFKSEFNIKLPEYLYKASDNEQMRYCTEKLANRIERDSKFAEKFTPRQLEQIKNGEPRISGLTWHHNEKPGIMQLVDGAEHSTVRHTGGRNIWGGGSGSR